jgi:ABC-type Fe3+ transport system substrate-binding protein
MVLKGAPVGYHCPEPVPGVASDVVILKGTPNLNAAKIFVNWLLSKEGQLSSMAVVHTTPIHRDLRRPEFIPFAEKILGKEIVYRDTKMQREITPKVRDFWNALWLGGGSGK